MPSDFQIPELFIRDFTMANRLPILPKNNNSRTRRRAPMNAPDLPALAAAGFSLDDKYPLEKGRVYISGPQALVRLPMLQKARDRKAGLNTAGFISGYRGSPPGALAPAPW